MRKMCLAAAILAVLVLATTSFSVGLKASQPANAAFKTKVRSVAVFKDGYGFFLREGTASLHNGWCMTDYIPNATAGTFWLYTVDPGTTVSTVRSTAKNEIRFERPGDLVESLGRCIGLQVSLRTDDAVTEGELLRILDDMVLVKSDKKVNVVAVADIKSAVILGQPLLVKVDAGKPVRDVTLKMGYLQQGINWVPSYTFDLVSPTEAQMVLRATITNQVEDLNGCTLFLVVGVPNFTMKGQLDPLTVHALGTATLRALPPGPAGPSQAVSNAVIAESSRAGGRFDFERREPSVNVPMEGIQDLYFYETQGIDMAAGDVVMTTIMTGTLPYRSVFTWEADAGKEVDHYIVLKNNLNSPLTTGPAMVMQKGRPISQDQLRYVSPKAEGRLKLTQATDIRTARNEKETERRKPENIDGLTYIPVVNEGELLIENNRSETAEVETSWTVPGRVIEASDKADVQSQVKTEDGLNPKSSLKCIVKVGPGNKHTVIYKYLRYVRARA